MRIEMCHIIGHTVIDEWYQSTEKKDYIDVSLRQQMPAK